MDIKDKIKLAPYNLTDDQAQWAVKTAEAMSTDEKVRQLFCMITYSDNEAYLTEMANAGYGGLMCRTMSKEELINVTTILQKKAKIPYLIAANMEAGMNQVCSTGTHVGCQMAVAATDDIHYAHELGRIIGEEGSALGLNWAFAPVIDIDYNWRNPITNTRTYGSDPERVAAMGSEYVRTVQAHGIAASIKHFPGDGVDERDQHLVTSINDLSADEWMQTYGMAYQRCIDAGALTVMAGHIMQPAWTKKLNPSIKDEEMMPATLSPELLQGLLRNELGFNGTVITDSSAMAGMGAMSRKEGIPASVAAGCDMILFTKNTAEDIQFLHEGLEKGILTSERLEEAVIRVLALKAALGLIDRKINNTIYPDKAKIDQIVGSPEHQAVSKEVADRSITLVKEEKGVLPLSPEKFPRILVYGKEADETDLAFGAPCKTNTFIDLLRKEGFTVDKYIPSEGFEGIEAPIAETVDQYDALIYLANMATKSNQTVVRLEWAQPMGADCPIYIHDLPNIFISIENPYHLIDVPRMKTYINTYGSTDTILEALVDKLTGRSPFKGKSPVDPFCGRWDTKLS